jgi:hypothetical protein
VITCAETLLFLLAISCFSYSHGYVLGFHVSQLRHVLVSIDFFETLSMGCFLIGNQRCNTLKEVFTKNNLHFLRYVYPDEPIQSAKFEVWPRFCMSSYPYLHSHTFL